MSLQIRLVPSLNIHGNTFKGINDDCVKLSKKWKLKDYILDVSSALAMSVHVSLIPNPPPPPPTPTPSKLHLSIPALDPLVQQPVLQLKLALYHHHRSGWDHFIIPGPTPSLLLPHCHNLPQHRRFFWRWLEKWWLYLEKQKKWYLKGKRHTQLFSNIRGLHYVLVVKTSTTSTQFRRKRHMKQYSQIKGLDH